MLLLLLLLVPLGARAGPDDAGVDDGGVLAGKTRDGSKTSPA